MPKTSDYPVNILRSATLMEARHEGAAWAYVYSLAFKKPGPGEIKWVPVPDAKTPAEASKGLDPYGVSGQIFLVHNYQPSVNPRIRPWREDVEVPPDVREIAIKAGFLPEVRSKE